MSLRYLLVLVLVSDVSASPAQCTADPSFSNRLTAEYKVPFEEIQDVLVGDEHFSQRWAELFQTKEQIKMRNSFNNYTVLSDWSFGDNDVYHRSVSYKRHHEVALIGDSWMNINENQSYSTSILGSIGEDIKERHLIFRKLSESVVPIAGMMTIEVFYCVIALPTSTLLIVDAKIAEVESGFFGEIAKDSASDGLTDHYKLIDFLLQQVEKKYRAHDEAENETKTTGLSKMDTAKSDSSLFMFLAAFLLFCTVIGLSYLCYSRFCSRPEHVPLAMEDTDTAPVIKISTIHPEKNVTFADVNSSS